MSKILLFYKYVSVPNPTNLVKQMRSTCQNLGLKGRIYIAYEGINGTIGGPQEATDMFKHYLLSHELFSDIDIKESVGSADYFPRLQIKLKKEIVNLGLDGESASPANAGTYLTPQEAHILMEKNNQDVIVFDARNDYEWAIGTFKNAIRPNIAYFRELPEYIDQNTEQFKDKKVIMYCTGGIRCERATAYLKSKNVAKEVYHIKGGIHRYIEAFPDGHFIGKNYVFDGRIAQEVTTDILGRCVHCAVAHDDYSNCINAECNKQILVCPDCVTQYHNTCSERCRELVKALKVNIRTIPHKIQITAEK